MTRILAFLNNLMAWRYMVALSIIFHVGQSAHGAEFQPYTLLTKGFRQIYFVTPEIVRQKTMTPDAATIKIAELCKSVDKRFARYKWPANPCGSISWKANVVSTENLPLMYAEFGTGQITTLVLGGVHPDELTPVPLAFRIAGYLRENEELLKRNNARVIVAPLVNPDGFLKDMPTRTNANGVDLNRNFFTADWYDRAKKVWANWKNRNAEHFPGHFPNTEIETLFQIRLIEKFAPAKIVSIHAPLGFLDYDGPGDNSMPAKDTETNAKAIAELMSKRSNNFRVIDFEYYPGSLGNFAGNERRIPTLTLELKSTDPGKEAEYWNTFAPGFVSLIEFPAKGQTMVDQALSLFYGDDHSQAQSSEGKRF